MLDVIFSWVLSSCVSIVIITIIYNIFIRLAQKQLTSKWIYYIGLILLIIALIPKLQLRGSDFINNPVLSGKLSNISSSYTSYSSYSSSLLSTLTSFRSFIFSYMKFIWLAGFIATLTFNVYRYNKFIKTVNRWCESLKSDLEMKILHQICYELSIKKNIKILRCPFVISPIMLGLRKPHILLPQIEYTEDELRFILKHECIHFKRKDLIFKYLLLFATAIHWFNPFIYLLVREISLQNEISCDQEVVKGFDNTIRKQYLESIISVISKNALQNKMPLSTNYDGGKKGMEERILAIMDSNKKKRNIIMPVSLICILGLVVILVYYFQPTFKVFSNGEKFSLEFISQSTTDAGFKKESSIYVDDNIKNLMLEGKVTTDGNTTLQIVSKSDGSVAYFETFSSVKNQNIKINMQELQTNSYYRIVFSSEDAKIGKLKLQSDNSLTQKPEKPKIH